MTRPGVRQPVYPGSPAVQQPFKPVTVININVDTRKAIVRDAFGAMMEIRCDIMRAKGNLPAQGEQWIIDRQYGDWCFGAILTGTTNGVEIPPQNVTGLPEIITEYDARITNVADDALTRDEELFQLRPTGTFEAYLGSIPPPGTLLANGQLVSRTTYAALWAWAQTQNAVGVGKPFSNGNGSTTFGLPDLQGKTIIGAGTFSGDTYTLGQVVGTARVALTLTQMPLHDHNVTLSGHVSHSHTITINNGGGHGHIISAVTYSNNATGHGHNSRPGYVSEGANDSFYGGAAIGTDGAGDHGHGAGSSSVTIPAHTVTETERGGTNPVDVRQPSFALNYLIYT